MEKDQNYILSPTKIPEKKIYDIYCDNYDSIHHLFVEFQLSWLQQAYEALKDLEKYNILVFLYKVDIGYSNTITKKTIFLTYVSSSTM